MRNDAHGGGAASGTKQQAREKIAEVKERTTEQVESRLTQEKSRAAQTLSGVSQSLLLSSQQLRDQQETNASRYIERAATEVDRLAHYLETRNVSDIVHQVETLARRQPALFLGGAVAIGFVAARFLKSNSRSDELDESSDSRAINRRYEEPAATRDYGRDRSDLSSRRMDTGW